MTFDGTHIHLADIGDDNVRMILPPSADGQAPIVYTYTVNGLDIPTGMAFDGTHIHLTDGADDNVRMITASVIRWSSTHRSHLYCPRFRQSSKRNFRRDTHPPCRRH